MARRDLHLSERHKSESEAVAGGTNGHGVWCQLPRRRGDAVILERAVGGMRLSQGSVVCVSGDMHADMRMVGMQVLCL